MFANKTSSGKHKRSCCVRGCSQAVRNSMVKDITNSFITFHSIPSQKEKRGKWVQAIRSHNGKDWIPKKASQVCSLHFGEYCWEKLREDGKKKLKWSAVPSHFTLPSQDLLPSEEPNTFDHPYYLPSTLQKRLGLCDTTNQNQISEHSYNQKLHFQSEHMKQTRRGEETILYTTVAPLVYPIKTDLKFEGAMQPGMLPISVSKTILKHDHPYSFTLKNNMHNLKPELPLSSDTDTASSPSHENDPIGLSELKVDLIEVKEEELSGEEELEGDVGTLTSDLNGNQYAPTCMITEISSHATQGYSDGSKRNVSDILRDVLDHLKISLPSYWVTLLKDKGIHVGLLAPSISYIIQRSLFILPDGLVLCTVHGKPLPRDHLFWNKIKKVPLSETTVKLFSDNITELVMYFASYEICRGCEDFKPLWKHVSNGRVDHNDFHETDYSSTCRSNDCVLLIEHSQINRCAACSKIYQSLSR